ncbi:MAG: PilN domain-containing protein [Oleiphilaceae bacterium]|nr:PilN domain-containing protein [Oleiphilaceae bacterium]
MKQRVNLYTPELRPRREWLTLNQLVLAGALCVLLMGLVSLALRWELGQEQQQLAQLRSEHAALTRVVEEMETALSERGVEPGLQEQVAQLERQVRQRRDLLSRTEQLTGGGEKGFSPYLRSLARQSDSGLWLTRIRVDLRSDQLRLQGRTKSGDQIPRYLNRLKQEPLFSGHGFGDFALERDPESGVLEFRLASSREEDNGRAQ